MTPALVLKPVAKKATTRDLKRDLQACRRRGARRGLAARYALRNLPPLEEDEP